MEFLDVAAVLGVDPSAVIQELQPKMGTRTDKLAKRVATLSEGQRVLGNSVIDALMKPVVTNRLVTSDVVSDEFLVEFGDVIKLHHMLSDDYLDKYRFEAAMERVYKRLGRNAIRPASSNNPGHDITVDGVAWSLKTQGDKGIKKQTLYISKFMEMGKGKWVDVNDLSKLRDTFLDHMKGYERIFQLRYFKQVAAASSPASHFYELVEIPKSLLQEAQVGQLAMVPTSKQTPKPGYCTVIDTDGQVRFRLYFDGGTERKLQIKDLRKDLCQVHATWEF